MAFNAGREFNKIASTQGADFFGALPQASQRQELRFAGNALRNMTRMKAAEKGIEAAEREGAANRRASLMNTIIGSVGDIAGAGISAGIKASRVPNYSATSTPATMSQITSPQSWSQGSQAVQGVYDSGFSWQKPIDYSVNLPGGGLSSGGYGGMGRNPYSINTTGW